VNAAQTPADKRGRASRPGDDPLDAAVDALEEVGRCAAVKTKAPRVAAKPRTAEVGAQRPGGPVARQKARQHHHGRMRAIRIGDSAKAPDAATERAQQPACFAPEKREGRGGVGAWQRGGFPGAEGAEGAGHGRSVRLSRQRGRFPSLPGTKAGKARALSSPLDESASASSWEPA